MEWVYQYIKDRIESFDDYYSCVKNGCNQFHAHKWIHFFASMYKDTKYKNDFIINLQERRILP
jgi:hypothetical protein